MHFFRSGKLWLEVIMGRTGKRIVLNEEERAALERFISSGNHAARNIRRAQIVLALDSSDDRKPLSQVLVAERFGVAKATVASIKSDFENLGLDAVLCRKKRESPPVPAKVNGEYEAHLIALSLTEPPQGYARWSVRLLADKTVELGYIDSISHMTVSRILKKPSSSPT